MLIVDNISAGYDGKDVIKNISFSLNKNTNLAVIGPNGSGKTTLLKVISKILPFKGKISMDGEAYDKMKRRDISYKIAMLSMQMGIYFSYTIFDTVMMGRYIHIKDRFSNKPQKEDIEKVLESLEAVNMLAEKDREITKLSSGQLQRVFLARTLAQDPHLILLDEPTSHLDLKCQIEIVDYLRKWSSKGSRAVIGVLHDINLALQLSDNILVMKDGGIHGIGTKEEIIQNSLLDSAFEMDVTQYMKSSLGMYK